MKVLFVVKSKVIETLGPQYLAAVVKKCGHDAKICDILDAEIVAGVWEPDVIGYSIHTGDREKFMKLNEALKTHLSFTSIVGGADVTFFPQGYDWADHIVQGEGENWMAEFLGSKIQYPDLDSIPHPDRTDFRDMAIRDFIASRGCTNTCAYCYTSAWNNMYPELAKIRFRSAKDVINEVTLIQPQFAYFQDSTFGTNIKWLRDFCREYGMKLRIPFHVHLRPNMVTQERVQLLADAGCVSVKIALETSSNRLRKLINRGHTNNEDVYTASRLLRKEKIALILQNMIGIPSATIEDDLETLEVNIKCHPAYAWVSIYQPYPSTPLAEFCEKEGYYDGNYSEIGDNFFDKSVLNIPNKHKEQVACLQRIFAFCVETQVMPEVSDLTWKRLPKFIHNAMRKVGDRRMFPGIISSPGQPEN
uniref:Putative radical SAM superfamily protein n=1 Tax=viral metagenome TaxID=1070528 RepID=A0A6H1ZVB3_9ZZZZ